MHENAPTGAWRGVLLTVVTSDHKEERKSEGDWKVFHILFSVYLFDSFITQICSSIT